MIKYWVVYRTGWLCNEKQIVDNWLLYHIEFWIHKHGMSLFISASIFPDIQIGSPGVSDSKKSACNSGDPGSIPEYGRFPGEGNSYQLQYSCLENPMDREAWQAAVHRVAESWTRLSTREIWYPVCYFEKFPWWRIQFL